MLVAWPKRIPNQWRRLILNLFPYGKLKLNRICALKLETVL